MISVQEFKTFLKAIVNSSRRKTVNEIIRDLKFHENINVNEFVAENGKRQLLDLINEWEEFTVYYDTTEPTVKLAKGGDHISKMNKHLKQKRGTINSISKQINSSRRLRVFGPDPFSFSPASSMNVFLNSDIDSQTTSFGYTEDFDDILNMTGNSSLQKVDIKSDKTAQKDKVSQETSTSESKRLPIKGIDQILKAFKAPRPAQLIPSTSKSVSKSSVSGSQVRQTPRQKLSIFKNSNPKIQLKLVKTIDKLIPSCNALDPKVKNVMPIAMLDIVNPHRFWFAEYNEYKALNGLMENMQEFYAKNQDSLRISVKDIQRGLYVAALYEGIWHRGMIVKKSENFVRICYVDFGTAYDTSHIDLCYLKEDFLNLPSIARRGVLAYVQPLESDEWSLDAGIFFEKNIKDKKVEVKIFKQISRDNSYYLGIKYKNEQKKEELLTTTMIINSLAKRDTNFLEKEIVSLDCFEFHEYEEGILLDMKPQTPNAIEAFDSWMPFDSSEKPSLMTNKTNSSTPIPTTNDSNKKRSAINAFNPPVKDASPLNTSTSRACGEIKRNLTNEFNHVAEYNDNQVESHEVVPQSQSSHSTFYAKQKLSDTNLTNSTFISTQDLSIKDSGLIKKQSFEKFGVGEEIKIHVHIIYDANCFFFYIKNEMAEIKKFLDDLNESCQENNEKLSDEDLEMNKNVVVFNDNNYCRARINSKIENKYQLFLVDFGVFLVKTYDKMFKLQKEHHKRPNCIYMGSLQNYSEEEYSNLKLACNGGFCVAKILGIRNERTVDLKLEAFN